MPLLWLKPPDKTLDLCFAVPFPLCRYLLYLSMWHGITLGPAADHPQPCVSRAAGGVGAI